MVDDVLDDRVIGVEVVVREVVSHAGDGLPRHARLTGQQLRADGLDRFTDLDQPDLTAS
jgi:hypothetical protein